LIHESTSVADLRYQSSFVGFLKPRPKLTFGWVQGCHSYLDSAAPSFLTKIDLETVDLDWQFCHTVKNQLIGGNSTMKTKKLTPPLEDTDGTLRMYLLRETTRSNAPDSSIELQIMSKVFFCLPGCAVCPNELTHNSS